VNLAPYRKSVVAVVGSFLTWAGVAYVPDGHVDRLEAYALGVAVATALGVYAVTNATPATPAPVALEPSVKVPAPVPVVVTPAAPLTLAPVVVPSVAPPVVRPTPVVAPLPLTTSEAEAEAADDVQKFADPEPVAVAPSVSSPSTTFPWDGTARP
jgi:hypothetical protein